MLHRVRQVHPRMRISAQVRHAERHRRRLRWVGAPDIALIIPVRNEELSLSGVLGNVPTVITRVVVVDNGSTDATAQVAAEYGARVTAQKQQAAPADKFIAAEPAK
jgi:cellulose synthase/poly-beta-1,6-N-acetylglucosamine synthase-like glycosyltransferase